MRVRKTVMPGECFVWGDGQGKCLWRVIPGTGCAHWVSHQLNLKGGRPGNNGCYKEFLIRVNDIIQPRRRIEFKKTKVGNLWTNERNSHIGIIRDVKTNDKGVVGVLVEHDSDSISEKGRGVVKNWFKCGNIYR